MIQNPLDKLQSHQHITPRILILASRFDLSCDYVVARLRRKKASYFRLNSEDFAHLAIEFVPGDALVSISTDNLTVQLEPDTLKAIYFRRGVYPRETFSGKHSAGEQLTRSHGSAFMRSFMVLESCRWINHPAATYRAEHKAIQLSMARAIGFDIPRTVITNNPTGVLRAAKGDPTVAVKGLDTVLVWEEGLETFGYTSLVETSLVEHYHLSSAPLIAQQALEDKLDLRVTVVGDRVFCASVTHAGSPIHGDWRLKKTGAEFQPFDLPAMVAEQCVQLTRSLGLVFGAIDLALQGGTYFFLEINPTGEWAWLVDHSNFPIDEAIADILLGTY